MLLATNNPKPVALKDFRAIFEKSSGDISESIPLSLSFTLTMT
jgi:hypothetical protein